MVIRFHFLLKQQRERDAWVNTERHEGFKVGVMRIPYSVRFSHKMQYGLS